MLMLIVVDDVEDVESDDFKYHEKVAVTEVEGANNLIEQGYTIEDTGRYTMCVGGCVQVYVCLDV